MGEQICSRTEYQRRYIFGSFPSFPHAYTNVFRLHHFVVVCPGIQHRGRGASISPKDLLHHEIAAWFGPRLP